MNAQILTSMIDVIRVEQQRRDLLLEGSESYEAYINWCYSDQPFINEMCLMLLVALWHHIERTLVDLAARSTDNGRQIGSRLYRERREALENRNKKGDTIGCNWEAIEERLELKPKEKRVTEALRLLANSYKHSPSPSKALLKFIGLVTDANYNTLPESDSLREGLAAFVGLPHDASYCDIAEHFVGITDGLLTAIEKRMKLSRVVDVCTMDPDSFLR